MIEYLDEFDEEKIIKGKTKEKNRALEKCCHFLFLHPSDLNLSFILGQLCTGHHLIIGHKSLVNVHLTMTLTP